MRESNLDIKAFEFAEGAGETSRRQMSHQLQEMSVSEYNTGDDRMYQA